MQDLHPSDRGPRGTHEGAVICNGNLYCPKTPAALLHLAPLPPGAEPADVAARDQQTAELARYKLGLHAAEDAGGYRRHACPAVTGKIRCPLRPESMKLSRDRPEILAPPEHPPPCCSQQTITAGPDVTEKTRQKHDYPSKQWRRSYRRRTAAERLNSSIKDTATSTIARGWIRLMGLTPLMLSLACLTAVRNQRILAAYQARQDDNARRAANGKPPRARRRRRELTGTAPPSPAPREPSARQQPSPHASTAPAGQPRPQPGHPGPRTADPQPGPAQRNASHARQQNVRPKCETEAGEM